MTVRTFMRDHRLGLAASVAIGGVGLAVVGVPHCPSAEAQLGVFDAGNYAQNALTAARTLQQINNQIQALQNQATMLTSMARNLKQAGFPEVDRLNQSLIAIDKLMGQGQGITFKAGDLDIQFDRLFPQSTPTNTTSAALAVQAKVRLDAATAAFRQTMQVQSQVVTAVQDDAPTLAALMGRSQGSEGGLQAAQVTNQLLALASKQQFQIENLMAAQFRAQAIERQARAQSTSDARDATKRFLGSGSFYPHQ
ncbi:MAG TPA: P-type conjugative transfer protein TrbJ [Sphingomonas sp.]|nr:P-type conjugative transfer protein TrbJ [Sphingomonas sp.]